MDGVGEVLVRQQKDGDLEPVGEIKTFSGQRDGFLNRTGCEEDPREFPVAGMEDEVQIPCSVRVGSPVAGLGRWATATTIGVSVIPASDTPPA